MDFMQLVYFKAVAETGHLTNAAKQLNIAQPALSMSISRLESEIGAPLFDRVGRRISLNRCGEIYLGYVRSILDLFSQAQREVDYCCNEQESVLNIGVISKPFPQIMINEFMESFEGGVVRQITIPASYSREELRNNEIDFIISNRSVEWEDTSQVLLSEEKMWLAVPAAHPLAGVKKVSLGSLVDENFINLPKEYNYRVITDEMCCQAGFTPRVVLECFHCQTMEMVASGVGISLVSESRAVSNAGNIQISFIQVVEPCPTLKHYLIWLGGRHLSHVAEAFRDFAVGYYKSNAVPPLSCETDCKIHIS